MLQAFTQFVSDHALQALLIFALYLAADDALVFIADVKTNGFTAVIHAPRALAQLIAEDVGSKAVVVVAGAGLLAFFAGGANPTQAALDALVAGAAASTALVINDIRIRVLALLGPAPVTKAALAQAKTP